MNRIWRLLCAVMGFDDRGKIAADAAAQAMNIEAARHHEAMRDITESGTDEADVLAALAHEMHDREQRRIAERGR